MKFFGWPLRSNAISVTAAGELAVETNEDNSNCEKESQRTMPGIPMMVSKDAEWRQYIIEAYEIPADVFDSIFDEHAATTTTQTQQQDLSDVIADGSIGRTIAILDQC